MSMQLQARGEGLCPVNTSCTSESLADFLEREGYTDVRVVIVNDKKVENSDAKPAARRIIRRPGASQPPGDPAPALSGASVRRRVTRVPRSR